jgi:hypothetical protein
MGANERSLHHEWPQNIEKSERNWDLCISFYGSPSNYPPHGPLEYSSLQPGVKKWIAIHRAMHENSPLWNYERVLVLDDDIRTSWLDINRFFNICADLDLVLAQPSLVPGCCINHTITEQRPNSLIRFTTFVEAMAPCFTTEALRLCIPCTAGGYYGFGIDHLWPKILGMPRNRIGIVDAVSIEHTRPFGSTYSMERALDEQKLLFENYGMNSFFGYQELGNIRL